MLLLESPHHGKIALLPSESALIARALERHAVNLTEPNQEPEMLMADALACFFAALACAMEFEFYLTPNDKDEALSAIGQKQKGAVS